MIKTLLKTVLVAVFFWQVAYAQDIFRLLPGPGTIVVEVGRWIFREREEVFQVTTQATAVDFATARDQALRLAVSEAVGSLLLSRVEVVNGQVQHNRIVNYASGYVHNSQQTCLRTETDGRTTICLRVWVKRSTLVDGLFNTSTTAGEIAGRQAADAYQSLRKENTSGNEILSAVLQRYPEGAFEIKHEASQVRMRRDGLPELEIRYTISWHPSWVRSMAEALKTTNQLADNQPCWFPSLRCADAYSYVTLQMRPGTWGVREHAVYRDTARFDLVRNAVAGRRLQLQVTVLDEWGDRRNVSCHNLQNWNILESDQWRVFLHAYGRVTDLVIVSGIAASGLEHLRRVKLDIVDQRSCTAT